jgi:ABC-type siderophore export system fused ATPase/permease subunit
MDSEARTLASLIARTPRLRRSLVISAVLALLASAAEIAMVATLIPIFSSIGVDTGTSLDDTTEMLRPAGWLVLFAMLAAARSTLNWLAAVRAEHGTQGMIISLQSRLYRALAAAHWDAVRRISPPRLTSALQTQAYDAGYGFGNAISLITASLLVAGYLFSSALVFPLALPALILVLVIVWRLNARRAAQVLSRSENYQESQTDLHQRYEDWVSISRIAALGVDSTQLADRFEADARAAASHAVGYSQSSSTTRANLLRPVTWPLGM